MKRRLRLFNAEHRHDLKKINYIETASERISFSKGAPLCIIFNVKRSAGI